MSNIAIMCKCVQISCLGCVEQNVVQNVPSLTRFLPIYRYKYYISVPKKNIFLLPTICDMRYIFASGCCELSRVNFLGEYISVYYISVPKKNIFLLPTTVNVSGVGE